MRAGDLRHRVSLQRQAASKDSFGQRLLTWETMTQMQCRISPISGKEAAIAGQMRSEITHEISCRYRPEFADPKIASTYRILFGNRIFNISSSVNRDERNREMTLMVVEGLNDG